MGNQGIFLLKLFLLSAGISAAIKYIAPGLEISASTGGVLSFVLAPSLLLATLLSWRGWRLAKQHSD